jgi:hypothetical protein
MRKIAIILLLINFIFVSSALSFALPDGSGGSYYGDIYKAPDYNYLNKDLNEIINAVLEGVATATPPEEGVPVFPYDPILYYLLIRGFGLDASMQQRVMQYLNKSFLESKKNELYKEIGSRYNTYEMISFLKSASNVSNLKDELNRGIINELFVPSAQKKVVVDVCDSLLQIIKCRDLDFDQTINGFIRNVSAQYQLGTYCGIKYEEIPFCENKTPQTIVLSPQRNGLFANIFKAFTGKIMIAQVGGENQTNQNELPPSVVIRDRWDYTKRDIESSQIIEQIAEGFKASLESAPVFRLGEPVRVIQCIRDDRGIVYPYRVEPINISLNFSGFSSGIGSNPVSLKNDEIFDFKNSVRNIFFNGIDIFNFENENKLLEYINNQCASLKTRVSDDNPNRTSPYSDCMISNLRMFVDSNNRAVKVFKDLKERINNFYLPIWTRVLDEVKDPNVSITGKLKDQMGLLINVYYQKGLVVDNLKTLTMPTSFSGCENFKDCVNYKDTLIKLANNFKNLKTIFETLAPLHPYSETAVINYTYSYFQVAHDIKTNCIDKPENIVNLGAYSKLNEKSRFANIKKVKIVKKIEINKSFKNFLASFSNIITSLFSPKEFTIKIER